MRSAGLRDGEGAIARRNELLAAIVRSASDAIIAIDAAGTILAWNQSARRHFGWSESEMIGLPISRLIPPGRLRDHERALARIFAGENVASFPSLYSALDGRDVAVSITLSPVLDASGMIVAASAVIRPRSAARSAPSTAPNRSAPGPAPRTDGDPFARRTILVVEDEAIIGLGFAAMLENSGFDVVGPVGDLGQAMALLDAHDCALAILDVSLARGETSEPLARRLRHEGIPFFLVSGAAQKDSRPDFAEARSLTKPVGARRLVATVHEMIG